MNRVHEDSSPESVMNQTFLMKDQVVDTSINSHEIKGAVEVSRSSSGKSPSAHFRKLPADQITRKVYLDGSTAPNMQRQDNRIVNSKYNFITFLPLVLYQQFNYFFNLYFLGLTITQFVPALRVGFLINYIGPLSLVVFLSICKEAYDDILRHQRDRGLNNQEYSVLHNGAQARVKSKDLKVGMIVQINHNDRIPADLLVLHTNNEEGHVFIRTDQLDGETDWKLRKAVKLTQAIPLSEMHQHKGYCKCEPPSAAIYSFKGIMIVHDEQQGKQKESLTLENVIWASTVLATGTIWGLVIFVGKDTRIARNSKLPQTKIGVFDREVNNLAKLLFFMMVCLTCVVTMFSNPVLDAKLIIVTFVRYLILLSNIIPISMRVNLEFAKLVYSIRINRDRDIPGTLTRNSNIPESLGRIHYLLSDKTGTLTQNEMNFRRLSLEHASYTHEQINQVRSLLLQQVESDSENENDIRRSRRKDKAAMVRDMILCIALCHNVTPVVDDQTGERTFQASSPDEVALVKFAEDVGMKLLTREQTKTTLQMPNDSIETYEILHNFPFSSDTKRMGVIMRNTANDQIIFYLKGADAVIKQFLRDMYRGFVDEECENLARAGLRTLVCAQRILSRPDYEQWLQQYEAANCKLADREESVAKVVAKLEKNVDFLGITGVLDKLQEDAAATVENLRQAGIKVWMLTGDKLETAICTSIASGLKTPTQQMLIIRDVQDEVKIKMLLQQLDIYEQDQLLVIDGTSLQVALDYHSELFFSIAGKATTVVCCRCSPTQKAKIADGLRNHTKQVVACIGDGGNDVGMIQQADVGIGIEGKEGKQAALASDFSILKFNYLNQLLLWHGRLSYKRSALLSQFVIHRGLLIASVQAVFMFLFYFLSISVFSGPLMLGYSTLFTMFPVFCIIFDEDVDINVALQFPPLYATLQKGRQLNTKTFLVWLWKAIYQGFIIILLSMLLIENAFLKIETTAFTCLIFTQYAMLLTELNSLHIVMIIMIILSLIVYILTIYLFQAQLLVSSMTWTFFGYVFLILLVSWGPLAVARRVITIFDPSDFEKIMKNVKREAIKTHL